MAYLPLSEKEKEDQAAQGGPATAENVLSGESGTLTPGAADAPSATPAAAGSAQTPSRSGFVNLQKYVTANEGNDGALGAKVTSKVGADAADATANIDTFKTNAQSAVSAGTVSDSGVVGAVKQAPTTVNKDQFKKQYDASYGGPADAQSVEGYGAALTGATKVGTAVGMAAAPGLSGKMELLKDAYATQDKQYSRGEQKLDGFLLGAGAQGAQALQGIQDTYGTFGQGLTAATDDVTKSIEDAKAVTTKTRDDTRDAYTGAKLGFDEKFKGLQGLVGSKNTAASGQYQDLTAGKDAALKSAGYDDATIGWLRDHNYDFSKVADAGKAYTLGDLADDGDVGNYKALLDLNGDGPQYDFAKGGGADAAVRQDQFLGSQNVRNIESDLSNRLKIAEGGRESDWAAIDSMDPAFLAARGISQADVALAKRYGIDPKTFFTKGRALTAGDLASDSQRQQYAGLLKALGVAGGQDLTDAGDEGSSYAFNQTGWAGKLQAAKGWSDLEGIQSGLVSFAPKEQEAAAAKLRIPPDVFADAQRLGVDAMSFLAKTPTGYTFDRGGYYAARAAATTAAHGAPTPPATQAPAPTASAPGPATAGKRPDNLSGEDMGNLMDKGLDTIHRDTVDPVEAATDYFKIGNDSNPYTSSWSDATTKQDIKPIRFGKLKGMIH